MRQMVPEAEAHLGKENVAGYYEIIHSDWMSSDHSDCGDADPNEFKKHRESKIGGNRGWETRTLVWRSKKVSQTKPVL